MSSRAVGRRPLAPRVLGRPSEAGANKWNKLAHRRNNSARRKGACKVSRPGRGRLQDNGVANEQQPPGSAARALIS